MRVIAGKYKKRKLFSVPGNTTRPTSDAVKEAIFSIIQNCENFQVLDLYAGSGSLGFEALSRGAGFVDFVDFSQKAIATMKRNLEKLGCGNQCHINRKMVSSLIAKTEKKFDLIFMDPPYNKKLVNTTIEAVFKNNILSENGQLIVEHYKYEKIDPAWKDQTISYKVYSTTCITILINKTKRENHENL